MQEMFKRPYRIRRATVRGKENTIAPEVKMQPEDEVVQWHDGFILIVPYGAKVTERILRRATDLGSKDAEPKD